MEPFLRVGALLAARGHGVTCAFPEQYIHLAEEEGLATVGLDRRFLELVEGTEGKALMGGKGTLWQRGRGLYHLVREGLKINRRLVEQQVQLLEGQDFDRVVFHPKASFPFVWSVRYPGRAIVLSPVPWVIHPVPGHPHLGFGWLRRMGLSGLSYGLANFALLQNILPATKTYRRRYRISAADVRGAITGTKLFYNVSPALLDPPSEWPSHVRAFGYLSRTMDEDKSLDPAVANFMDRHAKFIVVTFGSMSNEDPAGKTDVLLRSLAETGIPAIINVAAGGLREPSDYDRERVLFTPTLPYDRVFARAYAVLHHGGAGTTQTGLLHACSTLIIPHIVDQFSWNRLIAERGLGPAGIPVRKLSSGVLANRLRDLFQNPVYFANVSELRDRMQQEQHSEAVCRFITG